MRCAALLLAGLVLGCGGGDDEPPPNPPPVPFDQCDASSRETVAQLFPALLGRRAASQDELETYHQVFNEAVRLGLPPREVTARALASRPEFAARWVDLTMDALRVQRADAQSQIGCWDPSAASSAGESIDVATHVRDALASSAGPASFSMIDLARSSLALDDVTPVLRAQLFAMVARPIYAANVPPIEAELARRADFGETFDAAYLNRDIVCLGCHTSAGAVTDNADPALDRHWPVAGLPEEAIYGSLNSTSIAAAHAAFRVDGFVLNGEQRPWGWNGDCGTFAPPAAIGADPAGVDGKLGSLRGQRLTVYDMDRALKNGFDQLRGTAGPALNPDGTFVEPDAALAWLVTLSIADKVWTEVVGSPLTIANYFPRNQASRDELERIARAFTSSGYSLRGLLVAIVSSEYFARQPAELACGESPYAYPAVWNPWTPGEADEAKRGNGPGDAVHSLSARTALAAADYALGWPVDETASFPEGFDIGCEGYSCDVLQDICDFQDYCCATADVVCAGGTTETSFQRGVGVFLRNSEVGFRGLDFQARLTWEDRYGACAKPDRVATDAIDDLVSRAGADTTATVGDVVAALKDRLINEPTIEASEAPLVAALVGDLAAPATSADAAGLRRLCGVLLGSPQFWLTGVAGRPGTSPRLTPPDQRAEAVCADLVSRGLGTPGFTATCGPTGLVLAPIL